MLICFDVDETLLTDEGYGQYVEGIIPTEWLIQLQNKGHKIAIVSPSPFLPKIFREKHWFKRNGSNDYRWENIKDAMSYYNIPDTEEVIYVDDLIGNHDIVTKVSHNVYCVTPEEFKYELYDEL